MRAIDLQKNAYGQDHPTLSRSYSNLGNVYLKQGKLKESEAMFVRSIDIEKNCYGQEHPSLAVTFSNLGNVYLV